MTVDSTEVDFLPNPASDQSDLIHRAPIRIKLKHFHADLPDFRERFRLGGRISGGVSLQVYLKCLPAFVMISRFETTLFLPNLISLIRVDFLCFFFDCTCCDRRELC